MQFANTGNVVDIPLPDTAEETIEEHCQQQPSIHADADDHIEANDDVNDADRGGGSGSKKKKKRDKDGKKLKEHKKEKKHKKHRDGHKKHKKNHKSQHHRKHQNKGGEDEHDAGGNTGDRFEDEEEEHERDEMYSKNVLAGDDQKNEERSSRGKSTVDYGKDMTLAQIMGP